MNTEAQEDINVDDETIVQDNYVEGDLEDDEEDRNDELEDENDDRR